MPKKVLIGVIILIIVIVGVYFGFFKKEKPEYSLIKVTRGDISQEVSESGTVKRGEEINLGFKNSGKIEKIYVKVGDKVKANQILAKLDTSQLSIQLKEAEAALEVAQSQLKKLLAGASKEEIKIAETSVANAKTSLESARKNLEDVEALSKENLTQAYEDALNVLNDAYLKSYNALETAKLIQRNYFPYSDQESLKVKEQKDKIEISYNQIKFYSEKVKTDPKEENINLALSETKKSLDSIFQSLSTIRQVCEISPYRETVSATDKASLDTQKSNITTVLTSITNAQQTISLTKITNDSNINTAKAQVLSAEGALKKSEDELSKILAPARQEDIDFYQAKVNQAQAQVDLLKTKIEEAKIISPTAGQITKIQKRAGEVIQLTEFVLSFLPENPFQVEADIYEEDIVKVKVGNPVDIKLTALPEKIFKGKVISIDPAEKIIENVIYYKVTISFEGTISEIKPGMTADIIIKTASKENVLIIPKSAIKEKDGKKITQVLEGKALKEKEIEIGLKGDDMVEVVSGLNEGEEIVIK